MKLINKIGLSLISIILIGTNIKSVDQPIETGVVQELANVLNNLQTMMIISAQLPQNVKDIKVIAPKLSQESKCLISKGKLPGCKELGCPDNKECVGAILGDLIKFLKPSTNVLFGSVGIVDTKSLYKPGVVYAVLDTVSKLPKAIPDKYKTSSVVAKLNQLMDKVKVVNTKLTSFATNLTAVLEFLDGLAFLLNPAKVIVEKKIDLPPIEIVPSELDDIKLEDIKID